MLILSCLLVQKQKYKTGTRAESQKKIKASNRKHRTRAHAQAYDEINTNRRKKTVGGGGGEGRREGGQDRGRGREGGRDDGERKGNRTRGRYLLAVTRTQDVGTIVEGEVRCLDGNTVTVISRHPRLPFAAIRVVPNFGENKNVVGQILKHMFGAALHVFSMCDCDVTHTKNINFHENSTESIGASLRIICSTMCVCVFAN